ncbi:Transcriptional regulator, TetR family [Caenispirillum salinarum AK4]|uniref:Transcriptional regulator, TetR family n=1 Tax=Caenispirillum salinarum AK4 TaxID=1238182 RepID=K9HX14_9PROT|nr:TetR/AcrR family transcriptional regulator [Caenispirillum salinarum]EKV32691.1 Transcriptional regulator, TetR family [Caenispirillum salinarum AK4]
MAQRDRQKQETRARIVAVAARLLRERGAAGMSVGDVMAQAGLTHGGFYAHFRTKDDLVAAALAEATEHREAWLAPRAGETEAQWVTGIARRYLNRGHRAEPAAGCPFPAVLAELARGDGPMRPALRAELEATLGRMAENLDRPSSDAGATRALSPDDKARGLLALFVGGLMISRAMDEDDGAAMLAAARRFAIAASQDEDHPA